MKQGLLLFGGLEFCGGGGAIHSSGFTPPPPGNVSQVEARYQVEARRRATVQKFITPVQNLPLQHRNERKRKRERYRKIEKEIQIDREIDREINREIIERNSTSCGYYTHPGASPPGN
jgi:hypothetical protein